MYNMSPTTLREPYNSAYLCEFITDNWNLIIAHVSWHHGAFRCALFQISKHRKWREFKRLNCGLLSRTTRLLSPSGNFANCFNYQSQNHKGYEILACLISINFKYHIISTSLYHICQERKLCQNIGRRLFDDRSDVITTKWAHRYQTCKEDRFSQPL